MVARAITIPWLYYQVTKWVGFIFGSLSVCLYMCDFSMSFLMSEAIQAM